MAVSCPAIFFKFFYTPIASDHNKIPEAFLHAKYTINVYMSWFCDADSDKETA